MEDLPPILRREASLLKRHGLSPSLIIEHHAKAQTKHVLQLIEIGQEAGFEKFGLRPMQYATPEQ